MCVNLSANSDFNPRSREGSDSDSQEQLFSIVHFNPRSREGSDSSALLAFSL